MGIFFKSNTAIPVYTCLSKSGSLSRGRSAYTALCWWFSINAGKLQMLVKAF
jgi:hypothetical protein